MAQLCPKGQWALLCRFSIECTRQAASGLPVQPPQPMRAVFLPSSHLQRGPQGGDSTQAWPSFTRSRRRLTLVRCSELSVFHKNEQGEANNSEGRAAPRSKRNTPGGAELEPSRSSLFSLMSQQSFSVVNRLQVHSEKPGQHTL